MNLKTGVARKQSTLSFSKNEYFLPPDTHTYVYISRGNKYSFFGKFGGLCFLATPVLRFALLPFKRRIDPSVSINITVKIVVNVSSFLLAAQKDNDDHEGGGKYLENSFWD